MSRYPAREHCPHPRDELQNRLVLGGSFGDRISIAGDHQPGGRHRTFGPAPVLLLGLRVVVVDPQEVGREIPEVDVWHPTPILPDGGASQLKGVRRAPAHGTARIDDRLHSGVLILRSMPEVILDDQTLWGMLPAARPVGAAVHHHRRMRIEPPQDLGQWPAGRREKELVDVEERDPTRILSMPFEAVLVSQRLSGDEGPVLDLDDPGVDLRLELRAPVVAASVVVEVEALDALDAVKAHPLRQVARLVAEDRADRERDRRPRAERRRPALPAVAGPTAPVPGPGRSFPEWGRRELSQPFLHRVFDEVGWLLAVVRLASIAVSSGANWTMVSSLTASTGNGS